MRKPLLAVTVLATLTVSGALGVRLWRSLESPIELPAVTAPWLPPAMMCDPPAPPPPPSFCGCDESTDDDTDDADQRPQPTPAARLRLAEAVEAEGSGAPPTSVPTHPATPLGDAEVQRLLAPLKPLPSQDHSAPPAPPAAPLPPPRTEKPTVVPFASQTPLPVPTRGPARTLTVLRAAPQGEVSWAAQLQIAFSESMHAVGDEAGQVAVRLTPDIPGRWRWLGTRVLTFEPTGRFPMATEYEVEAPAGLRSARGTALEAAYRWRFATPPPTLVERHPEGGPTRRDPVLFAGFDQAIDPRAVLATLRVTAGGVKRRLRLATPQEVGADADVRRRVRSAAAGRWLAFRCETPLPAGTKVRVALEPGTPSAEGPRRTSRVQEWSFTTHAALRVVEARCGVGTTCDPDSHWQIELTNPVDRSSFRAEMITVEPPIEGFHVSAAANRLCVYGLRRNNATYRVMLAPGLADIFGGRLGSTPALTFRVGTMAPTLVGPPEDLLVLDASRPPRLSVYSGAIAALDVSLYAVRPQDWPAYQRWRAGATARPGSLVHHHVEKTGGLGDGLAETAVDLTPALSDGVGQLLLVVQAAETAACATATRYSTWVQVTRIGLDALADQRRLLVWATALDDGRPLPGVAVALGGRRRQAVTNGSGQAFLSADQNATHDLVARLGKDIAFLPPQERWAMDGMWDSRESTPKPVGDDLRFHLLDDRGLYRPGETAHVKGWVRRVAGEPIADVQRAGATSVDYALHDSLGHQITRGTTGVNGFGGFDIALPLPPTINLGRAWLTVSAAQPLDKAANAGRHSFQVQEFRRPEYEVRVTGDGATHFAGDTASATVAARYFTGEPLREALVLWRVRALPARFTPPGRGEYRFGPWEQEGPPVETAQTGRTGPRGEHTLRVDLDAETTPRPWSVEASASVQGDSGQESTASARWLLHPAALHVGLKSERGFLAVGESEPIGVLVADIEGRSVDGRPVQLTIERIESKGPGLEQIVQTSRPALISSTSKPFPFVPRKAGLYRVRARVSDSQGRPNESEIRLWVTDRGGWTPEETPRKSVQLTADQQSYRPGDTARILVFAPFRGAQGLVTLWQAGLARTLPFRMTGATQTVEIPMPRELASPARVRVDLAGVAPEPSDGLSRPGSPRPMHATGELTLAIADPDRRLAVSAAPENPSLRPGGTTRVTVEVRDAARAPLAGAEVTVIVVDEAVLALCDYRLSDPHDAFRIAPIAPFDARHLREHARGTFTARDAARVIALWNLGVAGGIAGGVEGGVAGGAAGTAFLRDDLRPLALFAASLATDVRGQARAPVTVPDNLTRYRVMAIATDGERRFGTAESTLTVRQSLMVRPSPPRFLNRGDRANLPVVVQNTTDLPLVVDVAVRATHIRLTDGAGRRLVVEARDHALLHFPITAEDIGLAHVQVLARADRLAAHAEARGRPPATPVGPFADATEFTVPVHLPVALQSDATYGELAGDATIVLPIQLPAQALAGRDLGELRLTTSTTALSELGDAMEYLTAYRFECAEQVASRVLALAALRDVGRTLNAPGLPRPDQIDTRLRRDLARLRTLQTGDGGFAFWNREAHSWPIVSIHTAHALARARASGIQIDEQMCTRVKTYLRQIESHVAHYDKTSRLALWAYALDVRRLLGDADSAAARRLLAETKNEEPEIETSAWLMSVLASDPSATEAVERLRRLLEARTIETAGTAHFACGYREEQRAVLLASDRRTDAIALEALILAAPDNDLIPKLAAGLLAQRTAGHWATTQENAFALLALAHYFQRFETGRPESTARAWFDGTFLGEQVSASRTDRRHTDIPLARLAPPGSRHELQLSKSGAGLLHFRVGLRYAPEMLSPEQRGFTVERLYEGVDNAHDVQRAADGAWRLRAGARVRVRLTLIAPSRRHHVALTDPLPACLEPLNAELATTGPMPSDPDGSRRELWHDYQALHDERVVVSTAILPEGVWIYSYIARATTSGTFTAPPPEVEEMYSPETFGRGSTDYVVVE